MSETKLKLAEKFLIEFIQKGDLSSEDEQALFEAIRVLKENT